MLIAFALDNDLRRPRSLDAHPYRVNYITEEVIISIREETFLCPAFLQRRSVEAVAITTDVIILFQHQSLLLANGMDGVLFFIAALYELKDTAMGKRLRECVTPTRDSSQERRGRTAEDCSEGRGDSIDPYVNGGARPRYVDSSLRDRRLTRATQPGDNSSENTIANGLPPQPSPMTRLTLGNSQESQSNIFRFPTWSSAESPSQTMEEGQELLENFIHEEIHRHGLIEPDCPSPEFHGRRPGVPGEYSQPGWQEVGNELRVLAERFSQCEERQRILQRAESVDISSLKEESFFELLEELFQAAVIGTVTVMSSLVKQCVLTGIAILVAYGFYSAFWKKKEEMEEHSRVPIRDPSGPDESEVNARAESNPDVPAMPAQVYGLDLSACGDSVCVRMNADMNPPSSSDTEPFLSMNPDTGTECSTSTSVECMHFGTVAVSAGLSSSDTVAEQSLLNLNAITSTTNGESSVVNVSVPNAFPEPPSCSESSGFSSELKADDTSSISSMSAYTSISNQPSDYIVTSDELPSSDLLVSNVSNELQQHRRANEFSAEGMMDKDISNTSEIFPYGVATTDTGNECAATSSELSSLSALVSSAPNEPASHNESDGFSSAPLLAEIEPNLDGVSSLSAVATGASSEYSPDNTMSTCPLDTNAHVRNESLLPGSSGMCHPQPASSESMPKTDSNSDLADNMRIPDFSSSFGPNRFVCSVDHDATGEGAQVVDDNEAKPIQDECSTSLDTSAECRQDSNDGEVTSSIDIQYSNDYVDACYAPNSSSSYSEGGVQNDNEASACSTEATGSNESDQNVTQHQLQHEWSNAVRVEVSSSSDMRMVSHLREAIFRELRQTTVEEPEAAVEGARTQSSCVYSEMPCDTTDLHEPSSSSDTESYSDTYSTPVQSPGLQLLQPGTSYHHIHDETKQPVRSSLKRRIEEDPDEDSTPTPPKQRKTLAFNDVTVYYFPRTQGFTCVPSQGGSTLGMTLQHFHSEQLSLGEHETAQKRLHKAMLMELKAQDRRMSRSEDSHSEEELSDVSDSDVEVDSYMFLQPVSTRQRRALLRASGVRKIDALETDECRNIRVSREFCGCQCKVFCRPETCLCAISGIKCQVDRQNFPCGCTREGCENPHGRVEFNAHRVRSHLVQTLMRLEMERKQTEALSLMQQADTQRQDHQEQLDQDQHHHQVHQEHQQWLQRNFQMQNYGNREKPSNEGESSEASTYNGLQYLPHSSTNTEYSGTYTTNPQEVVMSPYFGVRIPGFSHNTGDIPTFPSYHLPVHALTYVRDPSCPFHSIYLNPNAGSSASSSGFEPPRYLEAPSSEPANDGGVEAKKSDEEPIESSESSQMSDEGGGGNEDFGQIIKKSMVETVSA
ncbi:unnamed protein product [Darwinula stevensoni]|uniref:Cysteine/serine-rich nuclear protein N-terminal domain-containing protein n=1 Tax=Darwinula stevensoni TaxID=69355 RepID=A0A7R8XCN1_9CRUS|nr:unnamed protein product [Darwinula stevensoni]CAG0889004.1 unnamed protein product [Darwinula stevensoni]